ncbi:TPA: hypothetical protein SIA28_001083 [Aeromonas salmonicida]|nr:hypothetical protein [Aeromonas bestiarum]HEH9412499.1 hypothetical protein [Aeromonas salmonicida]HEH9421065.1 hypothetical protein [Aeromonas salmonicida]HEH9434566.1 hypothetical protein [Aeromonas salmonicida]
MRGQDLDALIENELQFMLLEGFEKAPISAKALHTRLKTKGILGGGLSTLSTISRKRLIAAYIDQQLSPLNLRPKEKQQYVNRKTRQALLSRNKQLQDEVIEAHEHLARNIYSLIDIVKAVKLNTMIPIESLLSEHMIRELQKTKMERD